MLSIINKALEGFNYSVKDDVAHVLVDSGFVVITNDDNVLILTSLNKNKVVTGKITLQGKAINDETIAKAVLLLA